MSSSDPPSSFSVHNERPNQGAQGNFYGPVTFHHQISKEEDQRFAGSADPPAHAPQTYLPRPPHPLFQARPGEFELLERVLCHRVSPQVPVRLGLVGLTGMGGVGKTQLAVELAYRCLQQQQFPAGIFWVCVSATSLVEWEQALADLAAQAQYLPPDDDLSHPERNRRRAHYFCRYLSEKPDALLILDNIEDPKVLTTILPTLAGREPACAILYTSRIQFAPPGIITHRVEPLSKEAALRLLLETTRPSLWQECFSGKQRSETQAAARICERVGYLPLALEQAQNWLRRDPSLTLERVDAVLNQRGALTLSETLFTIFELSWEQVQDEHTRLVFLLASFASLVTPVPAWLLGLAAGVGEHGDLWEPLGEIIHLLQDMSLLDVLSNTSEKQVQLHPLLRAFGQRWVAQNSESQRAIQEAGQRLVTACTNLNLLEQRVQRIGYWSCLEQVRTIRAYIEQLGIEEQRKSLRQMERCLDLEGHVLGRNACWWKDSFPAFFYQQIANRLTEMGISLPIGEPPEQWIRVDGPVEGEPPSLLRILEHPFAEQIMSVAFSPDGKLVLTGSRYGIIRLWDTTSGQLVMELEGHEGEITSVAFDPTGTKVLTGSIDKSARLWDVATGRLLRAFEGHEEWVWSVAFSPDGKLILTGSHDATACIWETESGNKLRTLDVEGVLPAAERQMDGSIYRIYSAIYSVAFSPDGRLVATGCGNSNTYIWETERGELVGTLPLGGSRFRPVESVVFSRDGNRILTGCAGVYLWETNSGQLLKAFEGTYYVGTQAVFSLDEQRILTITPGNSSALRETSSGKLLATFESPNDWTSVCAAFSPNGEQVLTASDNVVRIWENAKDQNSTISFKDNELDERIGSVAFSSDGIMVLTGTFDGEIRLWETSSGKLLATFEDPDDQDDWSANHVAFSQDRAKVLADSLGKIRVWDTASSRLIVRFQGEGKYLAFSPDGNLVISNEGEKQREASEGKGNANLKRIHVWETMSGKLWATLEGHEGEVTSAAFSPDGTWILTGSADQTARLWETGSGRKLATLGGHKEGITGVAFSPDGTCILTFSPKRVMLGSIATQKLLLALQGFNRLKQVFFSPDGAFLLMYEEDRWVHLWKLNGSESKPVGMFRPTYTFGDVFWRDKQRLVVAGAQRLRGRPLLHQLTLLGINV